LSVALLLRYSLGLSEEAVAVEKAVDEVLSAGHRTGDIADAGTASVGTKYLGQRIADALESSQ
ncbi:MAG TPA: 3-isopropylmalate dehydrogenase, partial [Dehalococcoidia bacterium]|nr:3-isopropylmalate dehydrogenase [Dehalococcoidia bacterium]